MTRPSRTLACTMDEEQTEAKTGQQTAETPAASEATPPRDVARPRKAKRKRGRPKGSPNKPKPPTSTSSSPAPSSSPAAIESDDESDDESEGGETAEGRSERYAEGRRAIADGAPAIARMLAPFAPAIGHGLDVAAGTPIAQASVTIHHTTARGEPRTTTGTPADAVVVALSEAIAYLTPSAALATLDHPLAPALATVGGVAVAILGSRLAALLAAMSSPAPSSSVDSGASSGDVASSPAPSSSAESIAVRDEATGAVLS